MDKSAIHPKASNMVREFNDERNRILASLTLKDLISSRTYFLRSGEITNASELAYHILDEFFELKQKPLRDTLIRKLKSALPTIDEKNLYRYIVEESDAFKEEYERKLNALTKEFFENYCSNSGEISWASFA